MQKQTQKQRAVRLAEECEAAVNAVLLAKAYAETKREQVEAVKREELAKVAYMVAPEHLDGDAPERITEPKNDWLMTPADFADYLAHLDKVERERGIKPDDMPAEHCPALVAESLLVDAENLLIDIAWSHVSPDGTMNGRTMLYLEKRERFIDLICGLVVNRPGYKNPLTGKAA